MNLTQLIYLSRARAEGPQAGSRLHLLRDVLAVSQRNNARDGLTGFLLFDGTWFVQILEGEREGVMTAYARIEKDPRHSHIELLSTRMVRRRSFPRWSMRGSPRTIDQLEVFLRHGISDVLDPRRLTAPTVLALALDLQDFQAASAGGALAAG